MSQFRNILIIFVYIVYTLLQHISPTVARKYYHDHERDVPCPYFDTINITDNSVKLTNGSYLYDGILLPSNLVGYYNYIYTDLATRVEVQPHLRGCVCRVKPCINLCCPRGSHNVNWTTLCEKDYKYETKVPLLNVTMGANQTNVTEVRIFEHFVTQIFLPYELLSSSNFPWHLYENGTIIYSDNDTFEKIEYCLMFNEDDTNDELYTINPAYFKYTVPQLEVIAHIEGLAMLFSIPFLIITIIVYLCTPELLDSHGKCFVCHMICLLFEVFVPIFLKHFRHMRGACVLEGSLILFGATAAFSWLTVISFDLWYNFSSNHAATRWKEIKMFLFYSLFAWGIPFLLALGKWYLYYYSAELLEFKTKYEYTDCEKEEDVVGICLMALPCLFMILLNITLFIMTAEKIYGTQRQIERAMSAEDSANKKDEFMIFLRLFMILGITWLPTLFENFLDENLWSWRIYFIVFDLFNYGHGLLIFMMFVMKKKVRKIISQRWCCCCCSKQGQQNKLTTSSPEPSTTSPQEHSASTKLVELREHY